MDWIESMHRSSSSSAAPVRCVNSRGEPLEVIGAPDSSLPSWALQQHHRQLQYVDPLFHHPDFDDYSSSSSSIDDDFEQSSFSDNDNAPTAPTLHLHLHQSRPNRDGGSSVVTIPSRDQVVLVTPPEEGECQLGGVLGMLARAFSSYKQTQLQTPAHYEYAGDPDSALERTMTCPISKEIMIDPVVDPDGNSYERAAILQWLYRSPRSPITRKPLSRGDLVPNRALQAVIHQYIQMGGATGLHKQEHEE